MTIRGGSAAISFGIWVGVLLAAVSVSSGCQGNPSEDDASSSGGTPDSSSGGTASSGSGGTAGDASGGASENNPPGVGGVVATMTEEEWLAATAPKQGEHEVWTVDSCSDTHTIANERISQDYRVVHDVMCEVVDPFAQVMRRDCAISGCESAADCDAKPRGRCEGFIDPTEPPSCFYPASLPTECTSDEDCQARPGGHCPEPPLANQRVEWSCYPTGDCISPRSCYYDSPASNGCESDADCTSAPDGQCIRPIRFTQCRYGACSEDAECDDGQRCGCGFCIDASCTGDDDCLPDETCAINYPCSGAPSYQCTTPDDECDPHPIDCIFEEDRWIRYDGTCE